MDEHRAAEIDRSYQVFHDVPLDTEDEWGNLAEFLEAARLGVNELPQRGEQE